MRQLFQRLSSKLYELAANEQGQDLVEYALVVALISFSAVAGMRTLATTVNTVFTNITTVLSSTIT